MIYFDNAATSKIKPKSVIDAFMYYINEIGVSPGRGSYALSIQASRMLYQARKTVAKYFGINDSENVIFTKNSTEAINLFFNGFLKQGDHVLISSYEHNAVLRPLHMLKTKGIIEYTVIPQENVDISDYIKSNTKLLAITLASNLTGRIIYNKNIVAEAHNRGLTVFVDSSQGAGKKLINISQDNIDVVAFTGHKDLLSLPGVGGLVSRKPLLITPLIQGGTGIHGENYINPEVYPDSYEAGTLNMPAIWALKAAIEYIEENITNITKYESELISYLLDRMKKLTNINLYEPEVARVSTVCFNIKNIPSNEVVHFLDSREICVRGGTHCAILAHETIGTVNTGTVRVSMNYSNTKAEIDYFIDAIREFK